MRITVVGGTGVLGSEVVARLRSRGVDVVPAARSTGVDLLTGDGLEDALRGCDAVVETSKVNLDDPDLDIVGVTRRSMENLLSACAVAGVSRVVHTSIHGIDDPRLAEFTFYEAKRTQEELVEAADLERCILRSTQWFEFALSPAATQEYDDRVAVQEWLIQPVAASSVAVELADLVLADELPRSETVAGPDRIRLPELTTRYLRAIGDRRDVVTVPANLSAFAEGALLAPPRARLLGPNLEEWLAAPETS